MICLSYIYSCRQETSSLLLYYLLYIHLTSLIFLLLTTIHIYYMWLKPQALSLILAFLFYINILSFLNSHKFKFYFSNNKTGNTTVTWSRKNLIIFLILGKLLLNFGCTDNIIFTKFKITCHLWHQLKLHLEYYFNQYYISSEHSIWKLTSTIALCHGVKFIKTRKKKCSPGSIDNSTYSIRMLSEILLNVGIRFPPNFKNYSLHNRFFSGPKSLVTIINTKLINLLRFVHLKLSALYLLLKLFGEHLDYPAERLEFMSRHHSTYKCLVTGQLFPLSGDHAVKGEGAPPSDIHDESVT